MKELPEWWPPSTRIGHLKYSESRGAGKCEARRPAFCSMALVTTCLIAGLSKPPIRQRAAGDFANAPSSTRSGRERRDRFLALSFRPRLCRPCTGSGAPRFATSRSVRPATWQIDELHRCPDRSGNCLVVNRRTRSPIPEVMLPARCLRRLDAASYSRSIADALSAKFGSGPWFVSDTGASCT